MYARNHFGLAPRGNGEDTHRIWEMLYFGMVPIVLASPLSRWNLYEGFPVLVLEKDYASLCGMDMVGVYNKIRQLKLLPVPDEMFTMRYWLQKYTTYSSGKNVVNESFDRCDRVPLVKNETDIEVSNWNWLFL